MISIGSSLANRRVWDLYPSPELPHPSTLCLSPSPSRAILYAPPDGDGGAKTSQHCIDKVQCGSPVSCPFSPKHNRDDDNGGDSCRLYTPSFVYALHDAMHAASKAPKRDKHKKRGGERDEGRTGCGQNKRGKTTPLSQKQPLRQGQWGQKQR